MFVLRASRSTLVTKESNQTTAAQRSGGGAKPAAGSKPNAPGRKSRPTLMPLLRWSSSRISWSGSAAARRGSKSMSTISGTSSPRARPISPAISSAMRAFSPWPAPRNLATYSPSSSASTTAGSEPPSRSGVTYRVAVTWRITPQVSCPGPRGARPHSGSDGQFGEWREPRPVPTSPASPRRRPPRPPCPAAQAPAAAPSSRGWDPASRAGPSPRTPSGPAARG